VKSKNQTVKNNETREKDKSGRRKESHPLMKEIGKVFCDR